MLGRALAKMKPHPTTREKLLTKLQIQWAQISQQVIQKLFRSLRTEVTRMNNQTRWSSTLLISFLSFFSMHPYLIELICGSDMNMMLNNFCVFLYPNTPNFTRHKFLDLSVYLFFKENEINFNIPNFCPPVY